MRRTTVPESYFVSGGVPGKTGVCAARANTENRAHLCRQYTIVSGLLFMHSSLTLVGTFRSLCNSSSDFPSDFPHCTCRFVTPCP